jgi:hypothetical protein
MAPVRLITRGAAAATGPRPGAADVKKTRRGRSVGRVG